MGKAQAGEWRAPDDHAGVCTDRCKKDGVLLLGLIQAFGPVRQLGPEQLLSLGSLVTEMSERELHHISFTNPAVLAHLGTLADWSLRKVRL